MKVRGFFLFSALAFCAIPQGLFATPAPLMNSFGDTVISPINFETPRYNAFTLPLSLPGGFDVVALHAANGVREKANFFSLPFDLPDMIGLDFAQDYKLSPDVWFTPQAYALIALSQPEALGAPSYIDLLNHESSGRTLPLLSHSFEAGFGFTLKSTEAFVMQFTVNSNFNPRQPDGRAIFSLKYHW